MEFMHPQHTHTTHHHAPQSAQHRDAPDEKKHSTERQHHEERVDHKEAHQAAKQHEHKAHDTAREHKEAAPGSFAAMPLLPQLHKALEREGYERPTPIQAQAIPPLLAGKDLLGCAQTGTGKTAAFVLPLLQHLSTVKKMPGRGRPRAVILAPTRELAAQIGESITAYGRFLHVTHTVIFGGVGQRPQTDALARGMDIVVATPGRLLDLMQQGFAILDQIEVFILDEADRMLDMGFIHDVKKIIVHLPPQRQSLFFSATLEPPVVQLARTMVRDPVHVTITPEKLTVERIKQRVLGVQGSKGAKELLLVKLMQDEKLDKVIIFTQMKHVANKVATHLHAAGIASAAIHGNKSQTARTQALHGFKMGKVRALVATDIAARGIDVDGITHVINYDLPNVPEQYVHRIGRTARAGADGDAISFCDPDEIPLLRDIERFIRQQIPIDPAHPLPRESGVIPTHFMQGRGGQGGSRGGGGHSGGRPQRSRDGQSSSSSGSRQGKPPRRRNDAAPYKSGQKKWR
jgi:ATP-dependent RNA helicase RhlE